MHIATLTDKKAELDLEIQVEKGVGYLTKENMKKVKSEIGVLPIDAIFTPVRRVALNVDNMRVGERTDYDRLQLEVETDGTITPESAFYRAAEILSKHFELFKDTFSEQEAEQQTKPKEAEKPKKKTATKKKK